MPAINFATHYSHNSPPSSNVPDSVTNPDGEHSTQVVLDKLPDLQAIRTISAALRFEEADPAFVSAILNSVAVIDAVHKDGDLLPFTVRSIEHTDSFGLYRSLRNPHGLFLPDYMGISNNCDCVKMTVAHEIGHALSQQILGALRGSGACCDDDLLINDWQAAFINSQAVRELIELYEKEYVDVVLPDGREGYHKVRHADIEYLLDPEEGWARSYSQYIALRSADDEMKKYLDTVRIRKYGPAYYGVQWDDKDFEFIAEAIEAILRSRGWR